MTSQTVEKVEDIHLFIKQNKEGRVDATAPLSWSISPKLVEELEEKGAWNPCLLIGIVNEGEEVGRYVVPLKSGMQYVQFTRPGTNVIYGTIVWSPSFKKEDQPNAAFLRRGESIFDTHDPAYEDIVSQIDALYEQYGDAEGWPSSAKEEVATLTSQQHALAWEGTEAIKDLCTRFHGNLHRTEAQGEIQVEVPSEMFAEEPPRWMKWLGNLWEWNTPARDQCHLRRRALGTAVVLPFASVLIALAFIVMEVITLGITGALLVLGMRDIDFDPIRDPIGSPKRIWEDVNSSIWWTKRTEVDREYEWEEQYRYDDRSIFFLAINPPFVLFYLAVGAGLWWLGAVDTLLIGIAAVVVVVIIIIFLNWVGPELFGSLQERKKQRQREQEEAEKSKSLSDELAFISGDAKKVTSLKDLPKERRTVNLRYQRLKAAVCKPFAK